MNTKHIYGKLVQPLETGVPAYIQIPEGIMRTSSVQHFFEHADGTTEILTQNTRYILHK